MKAVLLLLFIAFAFADDEKTIWTTLYSKIGNKYGAAGLMGNLYAESGLRPNNLQNSYEKKLGSDTAYTAKVDNGSYTRKQFSKDAGGYGLAQWTYWTRKQNLYDFAKGRGVSIANLNMQLEFLVNELKSSFKSVWNSLTNAKSVKEASNAVLLKFERPANQGVSVQNTRASYGQTYYNKYAGSTTTVKPETGSKATSTISSSNCTKRVATANLNIRKAPSTASAIVRVVKKGSSLCTVGKVGTFYKLNDSTYCAAAYLK